MSPRRTLTASRRPMRYRSVAGSAITPMPAAARSAMIASCSRAGSAASSVRCPTLTRPCQPARTVNEVRGNDFSQAKLEDMDFRGGVELSRQKLPGGEDYLFVADTCSAFAIAKELASSIKDADEIKRSQSLANLLAFYCSNGQSAQLFRVAIWGAFEREFRSRLISRGVSTATG